jgi:hypothetical protein
MENRIENCFGSQGSKALHGESVEECIDCEFFDKCNKMTMAITLQAIGTDLELIVQNGLNDGRLKCFKDLEDQMKDE